MNSMKRVGVAIVVVLMMVAQVASVGAQSGETMRLFFKDDETQVMVAAELDLGTSRVAREGYAYLTVETIEQDFDVIVTEREVLTRSEARAAGVTSLTVYGVIDYMSEEPGIIVTAQDGNFVYMFYLLMAPGSYGEPDTDAMFDLIIDTANMMLEDVPVPYGWTEDTADDDAKFI